MASVNRVTLIGNLTRDPALKYLPNQTPVVEFGLAMNHKFKTATGEQREDVCFVDCSAFGKPAEIINQYCQKGKQIYIEGRLKFDTWEDKQGGGKRSKHSVIVENFQFLGGREGAGGGAAAGGGDYNQSEGGSGSGGGYGGGGNSAGNTSGNSAGGNRGGYQRPLQRPAPTSRPQAASPPEPAFDDSPQIENDDIPF